ncbi:MAG: hypothetical protein AAB539_02265 [Patescibacteria group bacterium]
MNIGIFVKKIIRFTTYGILVGTVGLFAFLVSKDRSDHKVILNPLGHPYPDIAHAEADSADSGDSGDSADSADSGDSASDTTM